MGYIKELYLVKSKVTEWTTNNFGDRVGTVVENDTIEFNYDNAIDRYVSHCEDGNEASYELVDEKIVNAFNKLDEQFQQLVFNMVKSYELMEIDDSFEKVYDNSKIAINTMYESLASFMDATGLEIYNIENRYNELKKQFNLRGQAS